MCVVGGRGEIGVGRKCHYLCSRPFYARRDKAPDQCVWDLV